jgi:hypothetical protein
MSRAAKDQEIFNPTQKYVRIEFTGYGTEKLMSDPTSSAVDEKSPPEAAADLEAALREIVSRTPPKSSSQPNTDAERIRSAVARLTSNSIDALEALALELQDLQKFLQSEVQRVQSEIDSALAGMTIIIETLEPLKRSPDSIPVLTGTRLLGRKGRTYSGD